MTCRLKALRVGNFKAFAETQTIPLKPITLVFGPNSSGKSSFIHSLALAHQAQFGRDKQGRGRLDIHHTDIGGSAIDLGGYRQFVHRGEWRKRVEWGADLEVSSLKDDPQFRHLAQLLSPVQCIRLNLELGMDLGKDDKPAPGAEPRVKSVEILADGLELLRMSGRKKSGATLRLDRVASKHPVFRQLLEAIVENQTTSTQLLEEDYGAADQVIAELLPALVVHAEQFFPSSVELPRAEAGDASSVSQLFPLSRGNRAEDIAQAFRLIFPRALDDIIKGVSKVFAQELQRFQYLGPLRSFPARHLAFAEYEDANWYAGGGYAWDVVRRNDGVREAVNGWLGSSHMRTPYRLEVQTLVDTKTVRTAIDSGLDELLHGELDATTITRLLEGEGTYYEKSIAFFNARNAILGEQIERIVSDWSAEYRSLDAEKDKDVLVERIRIEVNDALNSAYDVGVFNFEFYDDDARRDDDGLIYETYQSEIGDSFMRLVEHSGAQSLKELVLVDVRKSTQVTHRDVGIGISQVLPVLVMAYGSKEKLLAMEQPEIHLHPALQAELGDVFIESALGERKNTFILETHSEHLILRLLRRVREGRLSPGDLSVLYVQPTESGSTVLEVRVDEDGDFIDRWPGGFFEEAFNEREAGR